MGIAAVDQDVSRLEQRDQLVDHLINGSAGLHHDHDLAGLLQQRDQLLHRMSADDRLALGPAGQEGVNLRGRAVEHGDGETVAGHVQDQVLAHHGQANQSDVGSRARSAHAVES